jgi:glutamate/tyrosine decarboxylase-like PLP-dependent enzyme
MFFSENGLNPTAFPSLRKFETEVVRMALSLLNGDGETVGNMTSGGTESILMAVKTARDWARGKYPEIIFPEMVLPASAHPAFDKAGAYFDVQVMRVPVNELYIPEIETIEKAINKNTILLVGSAPSYPHGMMDPIREIAKLALKNGILCHVDSCVGGFMLPFVRELGYEVPHFDFTVPGVTSISADLHKYGYAAKPASLILYRNKDIRRFQMHATTDWSGGIYASPTMTGSRPGGAIAAAWSVINFLGKEGYVDIADKVMKATKRLMVGVKSIEGLEIIGNPVMSIFAITSQELDIFEIGDEMSERGWHLDRQQYPNSLHISVNFAHTEIVDNFLKDLSLSVGRVKTPNLRTVMNRVLINFIGFITRLLPKKWISKIISLISPLITSNSPSPSSRSAAMYGMMGSLPNEGDLKEIVLDLIESFTEIQE